MAVDKEQVTEWSNGKFKLGVLLVNATSGNALLWVKLPVVPGATLRNEAVEVIIAPVQFLIFALVLWGGLIGGQNIAISVAVVGVRLWLLK